MTDELNTMADEAAEAGRTFTERVSVTGGELIETVQSLLREATVRKITIQDKDGRNLLEIPLYAGIAGALILGSATVLALIAAWFAQVSILIERDKGHDGGPTVVGEAVERAGGIGVERGVAGRWRPVGLLRLGHPQRRRRGPPHGRCPGVAPGPGHRFDR